MLLVTFHDFEYLFDKLREIVFVKVTFVLLVELFHDFLYFFFGWFFNVHQLCSRYHDLLKLWLLNSLIVINVDCLKCSIGKFAQFLFVLQNLVPHVYLLYTFIK